MFDRIRPSKVEYAEAFGLSTVFLSACDGYQDPDEYQNDTRITLDDDNLMSQFVDDICSEPEVETLNIFDEL